MNYCVNSLKAPEDKMIYTLKTNSQLVNIKLPKNSTKIMVASMYIQEVTGLNSKVDKTKSSHTTFLMSGFLSWSIKSLDRLATEKT